MPDPGCQYDQVIEINLNEVSGEGAFGGLLSMGQEGGGAGPTSTPSRAVDPWVLGPKPGRNWRQTEGHGIQPWGQPV